MNEDAKLDGEASGPMSRKAFEQLGDGEVAYIKQLNLDLAQKLFPALRGKLEGIDLYAVLGDEQAGGGHSIRLYFNPLVRFIWLGALIMFTGGAVSLSDRRLRVGAPIRARSRIAAAPAE